MKKTAYVVNTARAAVIDQKDFVEALESGTIAGAAVDVYWQEPVPQTPPLEDAQRSLHPPHGWPHYRRRRLVRRNDVPGSAGVPQRRAETVHLEESLKSVQTKYRGRATGLGPEESGLFLYMCGWHSADSAQRYCYDVTTESFQLCRS